jgi:superfamily II DNA or RNA helicase
MVGRELLPVEKIVHEISHDETVVESYIDLAKQLSKTVLYSTDFKEVGNASRELDTVTRQMTGIAKASAVANFVKILLESGEPVILAGWHREVYRIWLEMLREYKPLMFTGSESEKQKEENKQAFLRGESNLFIMSLRSGAGTDGLQARAKAIVFGEADWTSGVYEQLIGRLHRDGQDESVLAFFLFSTFGSDPVMRETLGLKASQARGITNPDDNPIKNMIDKNRIKNLAKNILDK